MDWDKLRIFHAVAEAGSFTHAGETLNLSQSAVSRQISSLEESLGVSLFHRHARGLVLTEQGELLQQTAGEIFGKLAMIEGRLHDSKQLPEGPLRVTTVGFLGSTWLAPLIHDLKEKYPGLQLTLLLDNRIYNLGMSEADAAIRLYKPEQPDLIQRHLATINFHIYGSKKYLKKHGTPKTVADLKNHTLIGYPDSITAPFSDPNWLLRVSGIDSHKDNNLLMMNSMHAIHCAVETGAGLAALPDYLMANNKNTEIVLPDTQPKGVEMYFVYPEQQRHSQRISVFRDFLLENISHANF
ncbi:MAG: LysR family transcriptional regulator [Rhodospirillales bacterium]|nr:LysR family transcriptional regulator [Rhodospirillales bacterium]